MNVEIIIVLAGLVTVIVVIAAILRRMALSPNLKNNLS
jgi:hypothetical protein